MPIEFHCSRCQSVLRVPDEIAGRKAQCPYCEEIQIVPIQQPPGNVPLQMDYDFPDSTAKFSPPATLTPCRVGFDELFQKTWDAFFNRIADFLLLGLIACVICFAVGMACGLLQSFSGFVIDADTITHNEEDPLAILFIFAASILINLPASLAQAYLFVGGVRYSLHLVRGGETQISLMFPNVLPAIYYVFSYLLVALAMFLPMLLGCGLFFAAWLTSDQGNNVNDFTMILLVVGFGIFLLFIPLSIYIGVRYFLTVCFIIDRGEGPIQAIRSSFAFTSGNVLVLLVNLVAYTFISIVVVLCTCYTGAILAYPLSTCLAAVAYLLLTGQFPRSAPQQYIAPQPRP